MTGSKIKCSVENCTYNEAYKCMASGIEVNAMGDGFASTSDGTCCTTFKTGSSTQSSTSQSSSTQSSASQKGSKFWIRDDN